MITGLQSAPESLFWYWITERHAIYRRRFLEHRPKPWTTDEVLLDYKFTNVYRELDTGTIWLRQNFLEPHRNDSLDLLAFNCCWYRMFNWTGTGALLGWQTDWHGPTVKEILFAAQAKKTQIFTGAHIVRSAFGVPKVDSIVDVCTALWALRKLVVELAVETQSLERVFKLLISVPYVGGFMAYEMVTDIRHTRLLEEAHDIMTWANAGPGAIRGLFRLYPDNERLRYRTAEALMRELLEKSRTALPAGMPPLEMRDIEHSLCEFDKYCRVKFGEGHPRAKYNGR